MNVMLISQCTKQAAVETCRILDQFAERRGDRTWQTHITQIGLETLKKLLKKTARKNTAVACHWMRSRDHTELLWIVGNASVFNEKGAVPTNRTSRNILRHQDENDWHTLEDIKILAAIAALFHDFGKASVQFQEKLQKNRKDQKILSDAYRHEWVSLRLFQAFVGDNKDDSAWLTRLSKLDEHIASSIQTNCLNNLVTDGFNQHKFAQSPFTYLPPVAKAIGWLILTHHFLPYRKKDFKHCKGENFLEVSIGPEWNSAREEATDKEKAKCWTFKTLAFSSKTWSAKASYWGTQALKRTQLLKTNWLDDFYSLHLARLCLMLADHHYSSLDANEKLSDTKFSLYANTDKNGERKQKLDEHLLGVAHHAKQIATFLPAMYKEFPRLTHRKEFKQRATVSRFYWQNKAFDLAASIRDRTIEHGFFGINMASTGCGKTLANGKIMYALANPNIGARFAIALGLRTLTLQTGQAYRERLNLTDDDLAILVGSAAVKELFELDKEQKKQEKEQEIKQWQAFGSESAESLMQEDSYVHYQGTSSLGSFDKWLEGKKGARKLLAAPIVVCTIDHLIGATESTRGGKQIIPMLRLMTSDLVLDEPDDFNIEDLPALSRLVYWAGMLGSRVLLSSATLPPAIVGGLFNAYKAGREAYEKSRGIPGKALNICCAWFDEYAAKSGDFAQHDAFMSEHNKFVEQRITKLNQEQVRRSAVIKPLAASSKDPLKVREEVAAQLHAMLHELHEQNGIEDEETGKKISFGLIRFANIDPLIDVAKCLFKQGAKDDHYLKLCCYHSHHPLIVRSAIENQLDCFLDQRKQNQKKRQERIKEEVLAINEKNIIFVVLASPVAEVGRDHDYDWAIVEPSSMRSIIQLAGRIRRHRIEPYNKTNIYLLNTNIKSLERINNEPTFCRPGFEKASRDGDFLLQSRFLEDLLKPHQYEAINAIPRIRDGDLSHYKTNLADFEHKRLSVLMLDDNVDEKTINVWWQTQAPLSGSLQKEQRFRQSRPQIRYGLLPDEFYEKYDFHKLEVNPPKRCEYLFNTVEDDLTGPRVTAWGKYEYAKLIEEYALRLDEDLYDCAMRFGFIDLPDENTTWCYHSVLGLRRKER